MTDTDESSIEALQSKLSQLKATHASLKADLLRLKEVPTSKEVERAKLQLERKELSSSLQQLGANALTLEDKCVLYRTAGWTVFEMDLDIGKRDREMRRQAGPNGSVKASLGLGVRLETYYKGRFYEPFYLIFAKPSQMLCDGPSILQPNKPEETSPEREGTETASSSRVRLLRHTIPHFVPLGEIVRDYLTPDEDVGVNSGAQGGLELLDILMRNEGLDLFLSHLHAYLQSFVSRRQQAVALSQLRLPGLNKSSLRAFGNDSFGQLSMRWELPTPTSKDLESFEKHEAILYNDKDRSEAANEAKRKRMEGEVNTSLEISVVYHDLSYDRVGQVAKQTSRRQQMIQSFGDAEVPGLKCAAATVLVESVRSRVPPARRGTFEKCENLQIRRIRRTDWESHFTTSQDSQPDLHAALGAVLQAAWREEMQRMLVRRE